MYWPPLKNETHSPPPTPPLPYNKPGPPPRTQRRCRRPAPRRPLLSRQRMGNSVPRTHARLPCPPQLEVYRYVSPSPSPLSPSLSLYH